MRQRYKRSTVSYEAAAGVHCHLHSTEQQTSSHCIRKVAMPYPGSEEKGPTGVMFISRGLQNVAFRDAFLIIIFK